MTFPGAEARAGARSLEGRTVLVTGATSGIGEAVAFRLAEAGARLLLAARSEGALSRLAGRTGGTALPLDLSDEGSVRTALEPLVQSPAGTLPDLVVNAAGVFTLAPLHLTAIEDFDRNLAVNLRGAFLLVRTLLPAFLARDSGRFVHVGSISGRHAFPGNGAYSASKFGLRGLHEVLVEELRGTGVRSTLLEPGACDTPIWDALDPDLDPSLPSRSAMLTPGEVAEAVLFVATCPDRVHLPFLPIERD